MPTIYTFLEAIILISIAVGALLYLLYIAAKKYVNWYRIKELKKESTKIESQSNSLRKQGLRKFKIQYKGHTAYVWAKSKKLAYQQYHKDRKYGVYNKTI